MLQKRDGRTHVYSRRNERFARNCVLEVDNFGGGSVMVWVPYHTPEKLNWCTFTPTLTPFDRDEVLTPHIVYATNLCRKVFQHDNARPNTARTTVDFLANQNVTVLP